MCIDAEWTGDRKWYKARIDDTLTNGDFKVTFLEYGDQAEITIGQIRLRGSLAHLHKNKKGDTEDNRGRSREREESRENERRNDRDRSTKRGFVSSCFLLFSLVVLHGGDSGT